MQLVWLAAAVIVTATWTTSIAAGWAASATPCRTISACNANSGTQLSITALQTLSQHGISIYAFAFVSAAISGFFLTIWLGLGALIVWRKPSDRGALVAAFFLVVFPVLLDSQIPFGLTLLAVVLFGLLFPDGRFAPQWTRWLAASAAVACLGSMVIGAALVLPIVAMIFVVFGLQISRFRSISTWNERQQTKWAVFGFVSGIFGFIALLGVPKGVGGSIPSVLINQLAYVTVISAIPLSIGISVFRNKLWDIDRIISRALAYTTLTITLAAIYVATVIGLQDLSGLVAGSSSIPAVAVSTLIVAALFNPLRRRIQRGIDRRFFRAKYDATRTLSAFGERLRDEVDLQQLAHDLTAVVHDALHPEHVTLWLREPASEGAASANARKSP